MENEMSYDVNSIYGGGFLKAADLQGREVTVTIDRVELVELDDGKKLCLHFKGKDKGLLLNKTNSVNVASMYGPQTDGWLGKPVTIGTSWVDFQGKSVEALRIRPRAPQPDHQAPAQYQPQPQAAPVHHGAPAPAPAHDFEDEIPFSPQVLG
jgi:hypothetical protein